MGVEECNKTLQKNLEETSTFLNTKGVKLNSTRKAKPEVGDIVQIVVKDNNYHNNVSYIRYIVYEGFEGGYHKFSARSWQKTQRQKGTVIITPEMFDKIYTGYVISTPSKKFEPSLLDELAIHEALQYKAALDECDAQVKAYKDYYWFAIWFKENMYDWVLYVISFLLGIGVSLLKDSYTRAMPINIFNILPIIIK